MDKIGPNKTNVDRIEPIWTKQDQSGLKQTKVCRLDRIEPKWTENDRIGPKTKVDKRDQLGLNKTNVD